MTMWRALHAGEMEFDCAHWSVFENAMDMAHIHYLHDGSFGNQDKPVINDMAVTRDTWGIAAKFKWVMAMGAGARDLLAA